MVIDILGAAKCKIFCVYRSFQPLGFMSPDSFFETQIEIISNALTTDSIILGDFNLDARMSNVPKYQRKIPLEKLNTFALNANLHQLVKNNVLGHV